MRIKPKFRQRRPELGPNGPDSAEFGQCCPKSGRIWSAQIWPISTQERTLPNIRRSWPKSGRARSTLAAFGQNVANCCPSLANIGAMLVEFAPNSVEVGPQSANLGRNRPRSGRPLPEFDQLRPQFSRARPEIGRNRNTCG